MKRILKIKRIVEIIKHDQVRKTPKFTILNFDRQVENDNRNRFINDAKNRKMMIC